MKRKIKINVLISRKQNCKRNKRQRERDEQKEKESDIGNQ